MIFVLACYGLTFAVCDATLLSWPRSYVRRIPFFDALLSCYFCAGFWCAAVVSVVYLTLTPAHHLVHALAGAASTYAINQTLVAIEGFHGRDDA
jgi:hypothetical protein